MFQSTVPPGGGGVEQGFLAKALGSLVGLDTPDSSRPAQARAAQPTQRVNRPARVPARTRIDTGPLVKTHPGFRTSRSVVLHRFGTEDDYESWRQSIMGVNALPGQMDRHAKDQFLAMNSMNFEQNPTQNMIGEFVIVRSQRNPTALFGAGLLDSIPESVIEEAAKVKHPGFPDVAGRISRLKDKRIGRFGWKAQTASLQDFVLTACAVELGLEVPGHHQGGSPQKPEAKAKGLDLALGECNSLAAYIRDFRGRRSERRQPPTKPMRSRRVVRSSPQSAARPVTPRNWATSTAFTATSCSMTWADSSAIPVSMACSIPARRKKKSSMTQGRSPMRPVMLRRRSQSKGSRRRWPVPGPPVRDCRSGTAASGTASTSASTNPGDRSGRSAGTVQNAGYGDAGRGGEGKRPTTGPASRFEWRTPPLWGFRDSGPYLHDGRAETLDQAVALHAGEAAMIASKFFRLSAKERRQVEAFLKSLTAPAPSELLAHAAN